MPDPIPPKPSQLIDLQLLEKLAHGTAAPKQLTGYKPTIIVPVGYSVTTLEKETRPRHIVQHPLFSRRESFVGYVARFKNDSSTIFADATDRGANFQAVLDYHKGPYESGAPETLGEGEDLDDILQPSGGIPAWTTHRASFTPEFSPEFKAWMGVNKKQQTQAEFLDFLRRWGWMVTSMESSDLLELMSTLEFTTAGTFQSKLRRTTGSVNLTFNEQIEGSATVNSQPVKLPDFLQLEELPVFTAGKEYKMEVDVLYRVGSGKLSITLEIRREHLVIRKAVDELVADVGEGTGIVPFIGSLQ